MSHLRRHEARRRSQPFAAVLGGVLAVLMALGLTVVGPGASTAQAGATATNASSLRIAYYFGTADPMNFWSSDMSRATKAFQTIRADGFDAVGLALPWAVFQPVLKPPTENQQAYSKLDYLINLANSLGLKVVLRLSYEYSVQPGAQLPGLQRQIGLYSKPSLLKDWLDFIIGVHQNVAKYPNVAMAYISWEDFFDPISQSLGTQGYSAQVALAKNIGFRAWLEKTFSSVGAFDFDYGFQYSKWTQVPTPTPSSSDWALIFNYDDSALINRFFYEAQGWWPGLSLEARTDVDSAQGQPVYHTDEYQLANTDNTGFYFSPYMWDPQPSQPNETASDAISALKSTLYFMASNSGGRSLFIHEFEFVSNAPQVSTAPHLKPGQVPSFLIQAAPYLASIGGYGVWTYRDFNFSLIYNPSFSLGKSGWGVRHATFGRNRLNMKAGSEASQKVHPYRVILGDSGNVTVSFTAVATHRTSVRVTLGGHPVRVAVLPGQTYYRVNLPTSDLGDGLLTLTANGRLSLSNVQLYGFTQWGDVYSSNGHTEGAHSALVQMNQAVASGG
jgi:hypothetical protein